jgi:hypothetical protein
VKPIPSSGPQGGGLSLPLKKSPSISPMGVSVTSLDSVFGTSVEDAVFGVNCVRDRACNKSCAVRQSARRVLLMC